MHYPTRRKIRRDSHSLHSIQSRSLFLNLLLSLLLIIPFIGCGDTIEPVTNDDQKTQNNVDKYQILYLHGTIDNGSGAYVLGNINGDVVRQFGELRINSPIGGGKGLFYEDSRTLRLIDLEVPDDPGITYTCDDSVSGFNSFSTAISPEGSHVAWIEIDEPNSWLVVVEVATGTRMTHPLTGNSQNYLRFSPDGKSVAFIQHGADVNGLFRINIDGTGYQLLSPLLSPVSIGEEVFDWSPDGSKIAFTYNSLITAVGDYLTGIVATDGSDSESGPSQTLAGMYPDWSPDGSKIVYTSLPGRKLAVINADGTGDTEVLNETGHSYFGRWSPDGRQILFAEIESENSFGVGRVKVIDYTTRTTILIPNFSYYFGIYWGPEVVS